MLKHHMVAVAALLLCAALRAGPGLADEYQDIQALYKQANRSEALNRLNAYLTQHPKDARARFLKGVILTEQKRTEDAIAVFTALTQDFPELPEPYNNLAVLYAGQGNYDRAREALEMAIRTHPSYATAHENLGDIYATLASQAYDKALKLDGRNATAGKKLALIRELFSIKAAAGEVVPKLEIPAAAEAVTPAPPIAPAQRAEPPKPQPPAPPAGTPSVQAGTPTVQRAPPVTAPAASAQSPPPPAAAPDQAAQAVLKTVEDWTKAWSSGDANTYLAFYAPDFRPPGREPRAQWQAVRRDRLAKAGRINVTAESPQVTFTDVNHATVTFRQNYTSETLRNTGRKTLRLVRQGERWLIQQESIDR